MSKKRNLFAGLICFLFAFVCLVSCVGVTLSPELAAKQQAETDAQEVLSKLVWDDEDRTAIVSSLIFTTQNKNYPGVTISWSSSEEDIIDTNGKVNRPDSDDPRNVLVGEDLLATVVITATVVAEYSWEDNGTQSASTEPITKQFTFTVLAKPEGTDTGTIEDVKLRAWNYIYVEQGVDKALVSNSSITYNVLLSGVVTAKLNADGATKGFMLHDGTDGIYVYGDNTKVNVGDSVEVIGGVYSYYGSLQVGSNVSVSKSNVKVTLPEYKEVTPQAWEDQNKGLGDEVIGHLGGDLYKVEGYLTASYNATTKDEFCITDAYTGETSWIYYKSYNAEMKAQLEAYVGKYVKVTGLGYDRDSRIVKNHLLWDGGIEEATAPVVDDQTKANVLLSQISLLATYEEDFDLNPAGVWEVVSGTGVEIVDGVAKVTRADEEQTVVLKVTVTVGEATASKELTVAIKAIVKETPKHAGTKEDPYTVSDAVLVAGGLADKEVTETVYAYGTVKEITDLSLSYGNATFTITDGTKDIIVFRAKYLNNEKFTSEDQLKVGDVVVIVGQLTNYGGTLEFNSGCYIDSFGDGQTPEPPVHEHVFVEGKCECGEVDPNYEAPVSSDKVEVTADNLGLGAYADGSKEVGGVQFDFVELGSYGNGIQWRNKTKASSLWNVTALAKPIAKIELVYNAAKATYSNANALKIQFGTDSSVGSYETFLSTENGVTNYTITPDAQTYTYVKFTINITYSMYFDSITIYYVDGDVVTPEPPVHEHVFVEGKCECGEVDPDYVAPEQPVAGEKVELNPEVLGLDAYADGSKTVDGVQFDFIELGSYGNGIQWRNKTKASSLWNVTALAKPIAKIELVYNAAKATYSNANALKIQFGTDSSVGSYETFLSTENGVTNYTITPDAQTYTYVKFTINITYSMYFDSITIYYVDGDVVTPEPPVHEHVFVEGKCECGEEDPNYVAPEQPVAGTTVTLTANVTANYNTSAEGEDVTSCTSLAGSDIFTLTVGAPTAAYKNQVYFATSGQIRLYSDASGVGNTLTIKSTKKIVSIAITYEAANRSGATFTIDGTTLAGATDVTEETIDVNGYSITIANNKTSGQVRLVSVVITYEA